MPVLKMVSLTRPVQVHDVITGDNRWVVADGIRGYDRSVLAAVELARRCKCGRCRVCGISAAFHRREA